MSSLSPEPNATESPLPPLPPPSPLSTTDFSLNLPLDSHALEPTTPTTPSHPESSEGKQKRNPLTDLVETEKIFVEQLTGIIRKVAAAWSRANLPPPELDTMFRSVEGIYRANRGLIAKLKLIDADPKSAGELGGLLIKWIDDLNDPYETYCSKYCCGFDDWEPVTSNPRLSKILAQFSESNPAPTSDALWSLDSLFLLPKTRLSYYLKLYKRLLKNTQNPLLVTAVETLNRLLDTFESRCLVRVGDERRREANPVLDSVDEVVIDMRTQTLSPPVAVSPALRPEDAKTGSETSSTHGSGSGGERSSRETQNTSSSRGSTQTLSMPITDLERRLSVERTLDIFTMAPKAVKLQMNPPSLPFTREMRISCDAVIRFTPRATGVEVVHREGHIFMLSDLFLICERMKPEERHLDGEGPDMWLCYPPLAGKVLRASEIDGQPNVLQVAIMKKEFLTLETGSREERDRLTHHFKECIEFSASAPPPSKNPPPPLPPLNVPRLQSDSILPNLLRPPDTVGPPPILVPDKMSLPANPSILRPVLPPLPPGQAPPPGAALSPGPVPPGSLPGSFSSVGPPPPLGVPRGQSPLRTSVSVHPLPLTPLRLSPIPPARSTGFIPGGHDANRPPLGPGYPIRGSMVPTPPFVPSLPPGHPNGRFPSPYPPTGMFPHRPPSDPAMGPGRPPQLPQGVMPPGFPPPNMPHMQRNSSFPNGLQLNGPPPRPMLPSQAQREGSIIIPFNEPSPPNSPEVVQRDLGPVTSTISAQMKCKVFLQQQHAQWKSLGSAKLKLYRQDPTNVKQLVVEADNKDKSVLISTIVLTDGVERVGKTGVAIELSDKGTRTGIIYMIQLRNETSAGGLFDSLLAGSDRSR